jgi:hypothetical protein
LESCPEWAVDEGQSAIRGLALKLLCGLTKTKKTKVKKIKMNIDSFPEPVWEDLKRKLLEDGAISPQVILITKSGAWIIDPFDFSN